MAAEPPTAATHAVTSRLYLSPTDYPLPEGTAEFPHATVFLQHLDQIWTWPGPGFVGHRYVDRFGCRDRLRLTTEPWLGSPAPAQHAVTDCRRQGNNGWVLAHRAPGVLDTQCGNQRTVVAARRLVIATGVNHCPHVPRELRGQAEAVGVPWWHSDDYVRLNLRTRLAGRRVLIVGGSDSASDIAVDLVQRRMNDDNLTPAAVYVSIRSGQWFRAGRPIPPRPGSHVGSHIPGGHVLQPLCGQPGRSRWPPWQ